MQGRTRRIGERTKELCGNYEEGAVCFQQYVKIIITAKLTHESKCSIAKEPRRHKCYKHIRLAINTCVTMHAMQMKAKSRGIELQWQFDSLCKKIERHIQ